MMEWIYFVDYIRGTRKLLHVSGTVLVTLASKLGTY
jgi:hypothetical protein